MGADRQVYLLDPKELSPETIAVTFAKTSRSPESFREIAAELTDEKSAQFHEKWVVGYGHASVAEHAVLHLAIENVSRLAIECIELNRLASYTEKSTRYQKWNPEHFCLPAELEGQAALQALYQETVRKLFDAYLRALPAVRAVVEGEEPRHEGESESAWDRRIRSQYVDVCRFLLPAAALANVGVTANARVLEHAICKMLSHPLAEVRAIGAEVKRVAQSEVPTLVKYAEASAYLQEAPLALRDAAAAVEGEGAPDDWCRLIQYDPDGEDRVLAVALYRFGGMSYAAALAHVQQAGAEARAGLAGDLLGRLGKFDIPLRELEHTTYTFDVLMDQGAYFEVKRHRMMTQNSAGADGPAGLRGSTAHHAGRLRGGLPRGHARRRLCLRRAGGLRPGSGGLRGAQRLPAAHPAGFQFALGFPFLLTALGGQRAFLGAPGGPAHRRGDLPGAPTAGKLPAPARRRELPDDR